MDAKIMAWTDPLITAIMFALAALMLRTIYRAAFGWGGWTSRNVGGGKPADSETTLHRVPREVIATTHTPQSERAPTEKMVGFALALAKKQGCPPPYLKSYAAVAAFIDQHKGK